MKKVFLSVAAFLGVTFFAVATPEQGNEVSSTPQAEEVVNIETATVDEYGTVDLSITFEAFPDEYLLAGGYGCGNGQCLCC